MAEGESWLRRFITEREPRPRGSNGRGGVIAEKVKRMRESRG